MRATIEAWVTKTRLAREARGLTRAEVVRRTGIHPKRLRELEEPGGPTPLGEEAIRLADAMGFLSQFFTGPPVRKLRPLCRRWRQA